MKYKHIFYGIFLIFIFSCGGKNSKNISYEFTAVRSGSLERTVSASGTIHPSATAKVLPQMSGKVEKVYVDYNDQVKRGDILAELNTDMLRLKRDQQMASVLKARANYELQLLNYRNQEALAQRNLISEFDLKTSKTNLDNQAADLAVAEANLQVIDTEINQYAFITSPIDGIVLDKNINTGDTVVDSSNSNSGSIFLLAENLHEMQIESNVGELDITSIHKGQQVRFTLESLPGRRYTGVVETLRMVPVVSNNVVSYTVIISVENYDRSLMPGMTCAVEYIVDRREDALMVANAALRYQPTALSADQISDMVFNAGLAGMTEEQRQEALSARERSQDSARQNSSSQGASSGLANIMMGQQPAGARMMGGARQSGNLGRQGQTQERPVQRVVMRNLWYINEEGRLSVMQAATGISDGSFTEILSEIPEGFQVILREKIF